MKKYFYGVLFFSLFVSVSFAEMVLQTVWGSHTIDHPLLEKLIQSRILERLKKIQQFGPAAYYGSAKAFTRFDHSIGVLVLLNRANVSLKEQTAGLLHDTSHTAFSHIADHLFYKANVTQSYQDTIHLEFLKEQGVEAITREFGILLEDLDPDLPTYAALEQHHPDICADRIQYILHEGVVTHSITSEEAKKIVDHLHFSKGQWYFTDAQWAARFAHLPLLFTKNNWGAPENFAIYEVFSALLKRAMSIGLLQKEDIQNGTDLEILNVLKNSEDSLIQNHLKELNHIKDSVQVVDYDESSSSSKPKFRGVDPWVQMDGKLVRLTDVDPVFKKDFEETQMWCKKGYAIRRSNTIH